VEKLAEITRPYDENGDALIAAMEQEFASIHMTPGDMVVFFPEDGHAPSMDWKGTSHVKKLIAKVLL
jgi:YhcH/YjgK/YiaL family protein